jgi:dihydrofolate reductase
VARLIYSAMTSLDGYVSGPDGRFEWAAPDAEVHAYINQLERPLGTYLYGRRMYEVMSPWQTLGTGANDPAVATEFAEIWREADKVVFSHTLEAVTTPRTRLERSFDPAAVQAWKEAATRDLSVGGPNLAGQALHAGLVDEIQLTVVPWAVGGGHPALPHGWHARLELVDEHRFTNGTVHLHHRLVR